MKRYNLSYINNGSFKGWMLTFKGREIMFARKKRMALINAPYFIDNAAGGTLVVKKKTGGIHSIYKFKGWHTKFK